jgi:hypothetical protein
MNLDQRSPPNDHQGILAGHAWLTDFLERQGTGLTVFYYEAGNPASEAAAQKAAQRAAGAGLRLVADEGAAILRGLRGPAQCRAGPFHDLSGLGVNGFPMRR